MKILAIDTSTEACSAALNINGLITTIFEIAPQQHSRLILAQCDTLLVDAGLSPQQLDAVAFGQGPGSFTGLRIAAGVTQGIAFASDLPVIGVSTLATQAQQICRLQPNKTYFSCIDARMKEIYWGIYQQKNDQLVQLLIEESVNIPSEIDYSNNEPLVGVGSGWREYRSCLDSALNLSKITDIYPDITPSAEEVAILAADKLQRGEFETADKAIPVYLRNNVAKKSVRTTRANNRLE